MKHLLWVGIVLALVLQPALPQMKGEKMESKKSGSVEDQIIKLSDEGREAALKSDASWLEKNTSDDYMTIGGSGTTLTKSQAIELRKSGDLKYSNIDVSDKKVRVHGSAAILTATASLKGTLKGNDISGTYRISQVWLKEGGSWKLANMQSTKVQSP
jgi:hypothetical protein